MQRPHNKYFNKVQIPPVKCDYAFYHGSSIISGCDKAHHFDCCLWSSRPRIWHGSQSSQAQSWSSSRAGAVGGILPGGNPKLTVCRHYHHVHKSTLEEGINSGVWNLVQSPGNAKPRYHHSIWRYLKTIKTSALCAESVLWLWNFRSVARTGVEFKEERRPLVFRRKKLNVPKGWSHVVVFWGCFCCHLGQAPWVSAGHKAPQPDRFLQELPQSSSVTALWPSSDLYGSGQL